MFKTNSYFDGKVVSIAYENQEGKATVGVMEIGEYEFGTSTVEYMTVISGSMDVQLPGQTNWKTYKPYETFIVPKDTRFKVRMKEQTAYKCIYK